MLNLIEQKDLDAANDVIRSINEKKKATRKLSELSPVSLLLIHNSMKQLNCNHMHITRTTVRSNREEYKLTPMDMDHMQIMPELKHGDYYVLLYGWNHAGDESGIFLRVPGRITCLCNPLTEEFRRPRTVNNPFAPKSPNGFIDFNWNRMDLEKSSISFTLNDEDEYVSVDLELVMDTNTEIIYETEKLPY